MIKRYLIVLLLIMPVFILSGCTPVVEEEQIPDSYSIYASFVPAYMLSDLIINENIPGMELHLLVQPQDGCMRNYMLSDWDAYIAMDADAVILIGNGLESFESALVSMGEDGPSVISASSSLVLDTSGAEETQESHLNGANPWLFLSCEGGLALTEAITANMIALDPDYEAEYIGNLKKAFDQFEALQTEITQIRQRIDLKKSVALAHEGLIYVANDFDLNVVTRIDRESGEYPDDFRLDEILEQLAASGAEVVMIEKQAPDLLVKALKARGYEVVLIDTLSTGKALNGSEAYFERMLENARLIEKTFQK